MSHSRAGERTWIDQAADRFEAEWKRGGDRPRIEDFVAHEAGPRRSLLLQELLRVERELRDRAGEMPGHEEYRRRFPDDRAALDAVFGHDSNGKPPGKPRVNAAQSLLFGLLALQNNFIDRDALLAAFNTRVVDKSQSLGQILLDRGALSPARHAVLQSLVRVHLQRHGFDPERSLSVLTVAPSVRDELEGLPDFELQASLLYLRLADGHRDDAEAESTVDRDEETTETDAEGRFRIVRFHDRDALGEVYVARDQQLHRIVALKRFHKAEEKGRDPGERMLALLKLLQRFLDVCNAIDYAHSRSVLHRDLKPGNIMLGKFG